LPARILVLSRRFAPAIPGTSSRFGLSQVTSNLPSHETLRNATSKLHLGRLLDDPNQLAPNLNSYINAFSPNVRAIM
jgi:hypothetical protein